MGAKSSNPISFVASLHDAAGYINGLTESFK